ncbi:MAG: hypothetical protein WCP26_12325, partial [Actinomycetes bacterium]
MAGTLLVLKAFQRGPMGVVSGVAASSTLVPLAYSLATGESLSALAVAGIALIFAGLLVFYVPSMKPNARSSSNCCAGLKPRTDTAPDAPEGALASATVRMCDVRSTTKSEGRRFRCLLTTNRFSGSETAIHVTTGPTAGSAEAGNPGS